jgi:membrane peptidoglycan carboxypeptidase
MSVDEPAAGNAEPQVEDAEPHAEVLETEDAVRTGQVRRTTRPRLLLPTVGAMVLLLASGVAGGGYYVTSVPTPELAPLASATTLQYNDGSVLAQIGSFDRTVLGQQDLVDVVKEAAIAAEDKDFWTSGTGAITRSVVRSATNTVATTTAAKARVAVQAWKLDGAYSKEEILAYYLNAIPFGRQTYGVEAAAREYFGKTARRDAPPERQLTTAEAMFLLALVRQPYPDPENEAGSPGFDPAAGELARQNSRQRWTEIRDEMVALNYLMAEAAAGLIYPDALAPSNGPQSALSAPAGLIVNHVMGELSHTAGSKFEGKTWDSIANGGYTVTTTIDARAQQVLQRTADETVAGSAMNGQPQNLQAAGVVVEPGSGRVLAYFGGHEGGGNDYGGFFYDEAGEAVGLGRYPPGGTFMLYTLAAALKAGMSLHSHWRWTPHEQPGRPSTNPIRNAGTCPSDVGTQTGACSLLESVALSLNVPMYDVTVSVTPAKVLEMARDAGINTMWTDDRVRQDLRATADMTTLVPAKFDLVLGIGQYPVTVLDQANAMATFAAGGLPATAHFVKEVRIRDEVLFGEVLPNPNQPRILSANEIADLTYALTWAGTGPTSGLAIKTGIWELTRQPNELAHAWSLGYTTKLAIAVHIGNRSDEHPLRDRTGVPVYGSGLPSTIMQTVMSAVHEQLGLEPTSFPAPVFAGNRNPPGSVPG